MSDLINNIQNNALAIFSGGAPRGIVKTIQAASTQTGVNFAYLLQQAAAESSFNPTAKAKTSSASGLYQFIESTWLSMVEKYGNKHGLKTDGKTRAEILDLRNDPRAASLMAAEFASENEKFLQTHWDGEVGSTELYFAHFLGAGQAAAFLNARDENPFQEAALLFPKAAKANRSIFYDQTTGRPKSLAEVYDYFDAKFSIADDTSQMDKPASPDLNYAKLNGDSRGLPSYNPASSYQNMVINPIEIMLMTQMDLPISRKSTEFTLFSAHSFLK